MDKILKNLKSLEKIKDQTNKLIVFNEDIIDALIIPQIQEYLFEFDIPNPSLEMVIPGEYSVRIYMNENDLEDWLISTDGPGLDERYAQEQVKYFANDYAEDYALYHKDMWVLAKA